jgi:hypothetical protein
VPGLPGLERLISLAQQLLADSTSPIRLRVVAVYANGQILVEERGKAVQAYSATEVPMRAGRYAWCLRSQGRIVVLGEA